MYICLVIYTIWLWDESNKCNISATYSPTRNDLSSTFKNGGDFNEVGFYIKKSCFHNWDFMWANFEISFNNLTTWREL